MLKDPLGSGSAEVQREKNGKHEAPLRYLHEQVPRATSCDDVNTAGNTTYTTGNEIGRKRTKTTQHKQKPKRYKVRNTTYDISVNGTTLATKDDGSQP